MDETFLDRINISENPEILLAIRKMVELGELAEVAYDQYQLSNAIEYYEGAIEIAESIGVNEVEVYLRSKCCECLKVEGRIKEALAMVAPVLEIDPSGADAADYYSSIVEYINIAIMIPCRLYAIEKAFTVAENFIRDKSDWRHMLLLLRAVLFYMRGNKPQALDIAKEAWSLWKDEYPNFDEDTHLNIIVNLCLEMEDIETAKYYINTWEKQENSSPTFREALLSSLRGRLALAEGNISEVIDLERTSIFAAKQVGGDILLTKILIEMGNSKDAREYIVVLRHLLHSSIMDLKYRYYRLIGSVHAVYAGYDIKEFGLRLPLMLNIRVSNENERIKHMKRAIFFYRMAEKVGKEIDEKLECDWRQREIKERIMMISTQLENLENV